MGKLSKVRTRKRGNSYSYIFEAGKKEDGKRKVIEHGGFSSRMMPITLAFQHTMIGNTGTSAYSRKRYA